MRFVAHLSLILGATLAALGPLAGQDAARSSDPKKVQFRAQGRVVDEKYRPIAGAKVFLGNDDEVRAGLIQNHPAATTGADGRFSVAVARRSSDSVRGALPLFLVFHAEGRVSGRTFAGSRNPYGFQVQDVGVRDLGDVVLPKGEPIQCRIRKKSGRPLEGALVLAEHPHREATMMFFAYGPKGIDYFSQAVTDAKGAAVVYGQGNAGVKIEVLAQGYYKHGIALHSPRMPLVLALEESGFVEGRVVDHEGKPVSAMLSVIAEMEPMNMTYVFFAGTYTSRFTNEDGSFRLNVDRRHRYRILAYPASRNRTIAAATGGRSKLLVGPQKGVEIRLKKPKGVLGGVLVKVVDADDKPIKDFRAVALWHWQNINQVNQEYLDLMFEGQALRPRAPGEALLQPPAQGNQNTGIVIVKAKGYASTILTKVQWHDDKPVQVTAKLEKEQVVEGTVVDQKTGKPVAGAEVWATYKRKKVNNATTYSMPGQPHPGAVLTDDKGRFRLGSLAKGKHRVHVEHPNHPKFKAKSFTLKADEPVKKVELKLRHGARWFGKVKGQHHKPGWKLKLVPTSNVQRGFGFMIVGQTGSSPGHVAKIHADGSFEFKGLGDGRYDAYLLVPRATPASGGSPHLEIKIPGMRRRIDEDDEAKSVDLDVAKALPCVIRGKVAFKGIPPPAGRVAVVAQSVGTQQQQLIVTGMPDTGGRSCALARDGSFAIHLPPGKHRLRILDLATKAVLWQSDDDVEVDAGQTKIQQLTLELAMVRLKLVPAEADQPVVASMLEVKIDWPKPAAGRGMAILDGGGVFTGVGLPLSNGERELTLYLPNREVKLRVRSNATSLSSPQNVGQPAVLGEHEFTPQPGKTNKIQLEVKPPQEIVEDMDQDGGQEDGKKKEQAAVERERVKAVERAKAVKRK